MIVERFRQEGDLPEGWVEAVLEDLIVHALGGEWGRGDEVAQDPDYVAVRVLRGLEFRDWNRERGVTAAERWIRRPSLAKRQLRAGDIVVEISGGGTEQPVGRTVLIDEATLRAARGPLICSNFCRQIRVHPEVDPAYVQLALRYQYHCGGFDEYQTQTTNIRNLSFSDFLRVSLPLPPLVEQRRIAERSLEILARVERTRDGLARVPPLLRRFRQSTLAAASSGLLSEDWRAAAPVPTGPESMAEVLSRVFSQRRDEWTEVTRLAAEAGVRPPRRPANLGPAECSAPAPLELPEIPVGWEMVPLGDLVKRAQYGTSVKATARAKGGVPILRMGNIQNGEIDTSSLKYVEPSLENLESFVLQPGDILFNRTNSPELVGKAAVWDRETRAVFASYLVRLTCDPRLVLSPYLCAWINSPWGRWWARTVRTDCVSQSNINASKLLAMPVPLPPLAEQVEIVRQMTELFQYADTIETRVATAIARSDKLERMVLAKALRGELVPNESEAASFDGRPFESGAILLERLRGQRSHPGRRLRTRLRRKKAEAREQEAAAPRATVLAARPAGSAPPGTGGVALEDYSPERILMAFRQACWGARVLSRDDLLRGVAYRLGFARLGQRVRTGLETHLRTAVARRIVAPSTDGTDGFYGATPKFGRYDYDFLIGTLRVVLRKNTDYEPEAVMRAVAVWLGFGNVTDAMRDRMNEVIEAALRRGILTAGAGDRLRRRI